MKLSTRLVLLLLGCLLPILTAQIYSQLNLYKHRHDQLSDMLLRQAEIAGADISSIVDGVRQLGAIAPAGDSCVQQLTSVHQTFQQYRFLALFSSPSGALLCASEDAPAELGSDHPPWLAKLLKIPDLAIGPPVTDPSGEPGFLPVAVRVAGPEPKVLIAAVNVDWLAKHLADGGAGASRSRTHLIFADPAGIVIGRFPNTADWARQILPDEFKPLLLRTEHGVENLTDPSGRTIIAAYAQTQTGLLAISAAVLPELAADIDQAAYQNLLAIGGAAIVALILAWVAGRRFIRRPSDDLLQAARKWREGDLSARATITDTGSEFAALGQSFNALAAGLQARRMQLSYLEAQVAERAREVSDINNRLHLEIAAREKTEEALHQAQKLQAVGQLAGGIAHDFNNMLATVLGNLELMERRISQAGGDWATLDSDRLLRLIERAAGAVTRGGQLTSGLLAFSRRRRLEAHATNVNALLRELITLATSTLGRRVQVMPELADDLWPAMVDPSQMESAILNLCLNARDAMPEGGRLTIQTVNLQVGSNMVWPAGKTAGPEQNLPPGDYVQVCVSDTGFGMSPEIKARALDPFFTTKPPGAGSGLGLSQVHAMVRKAAGSIILDSAPNEGTRVTLCLPRAAKVVDAGAPPAKRPVEASATRSTSELILVVDDDQAVRQVTVEMAQDLGCEVLQASGGEQALDLVDKLTSPPKLILLDYAMPGMNGLQLARAFRERGLKAPMALVTGYAELSDADVAAGELAGLLRKPFTIRDLQNLLARLRTSVVENEEFLEPGFAER